MADMVLAGRLRKADVVLAGRLRMADVLLAMLGEMPTYRQRGLRPPTYYQPLFREMSTLWRNIALLLRHGQLTQLTTHTFGAMVDVLLAVYWRMVDVLLAVYYETPTFCKTSRYFYSMDV